MPSALEYHRPVRRLFSPASALFSMVGAFLFLTLPSLAQINAPSSSVTSPGFGGRAVNGTSPSVTSVGPHGYSSHASVPNHAPANNGEHHHPHSNQYSGPYWYAYPVPYAVDPNAYTENPDANGNDNDDANYQGGPTVFDRRGSGASSYIPPIEDAAPAHAADQYVDPGGDSASAAAPSPSTTLVFKDGHTLDVGNYAIVGTTLFDLTPGHPRRIPLADLNLEATKKENDDRGVTFDLPGAQGS